MKAYKKIVFVMLITLIAVSSLSVFAGSAQAAINYQSSIVSTNPSVGASDSYTFTITNDGSDSLTNINITIPVGYIYFKNLVIAQQPPSQAWSVSENGTHIFLNQTGQGLSTGQSVTFTFDVTNPQVAGPYVWVINAGGSAPTTLTTNVSHSVRVTSILPALGILGIALAFGFLTSGISRALINHFVGWDQYHVMQKEIAEFRTEQMAAARSNDKKQMERLKKKQSQINNMNQKLFKPQMAQMATTFPITIIIWYLVLTPLLGNISLAYLPGFGPIPVFWLYPLCSVFGATIAQRIIGLMPIENR